MDAWVALTYDRHVDHAIAAARLFVGGNYLMFCRLTQLGLLRSMTIFASTTTVAVSEPGDM